MKAEGYVPSKGPQMSNDPNVVKVTCPNCKTELTADRNTMLVTCQKDLAKV